MKRFIDNCRSPTKHLGPVTTEEVSHVRDRWIRRVQERERQEPHYSKVKAQLDLRSNANHLESCHGRIQGKHPVYLPNKAKFTEMLVQQVHREVLHGGVGLTMAAVRERYWIPKLRSLVKRIRSKCNGCKRYHATAIPGPAPGMLPKDRSTVATAFEVVGTDFEGPIKYRQTGKKEGKAYIAIFSCSLCRAVHLELLKTLDSESFIHCLKHFIARHGRPRVIYSDNGGTFIKTAKWIRQLRRDERVQGLLEQYEIT